MTRVAAILLFLGFAPTAASAHPSPRGLVEVDWPMPNVRRALSPGYPDSLGLYAFPLRELPRARDVEGKRCVEASFVALDVDDHFAFDVDEVVSIELVVDRRSTDAFLFSYDRNGSAEPVTRVDVPKDAGSRLHREVLRLERARFANRGMGGTDLALVATGATFPVPEGESNVLTLCEVALERSGAKKPPPAPGRIELSVVDGATSEPTSARVGLYDATGRMPLPSAEALTISLNIRTPIDERERYFLYHELFEEYSRQGALSGYAHVGSGEFREDLGLALDAPFGLVDFVEVMQDGSLRTELWYELLNLGFKLTPMAGSDFPYFYDDSLVHELDESGFIDRLYDTS